MAVARFLVFSSDGVEDGDDVGGAVGKIGCAGHRRLVDVHGVRVLKDWEAARREADAVVEFLSSLI